MLTGWKPPRFYSDWLFLGPMREGKGGNGWPLERGLLEAEESSFLEAAVGQRESDSYTVLRGVATTETHRSLFVRRPTSHRFRVLSSRRPLESAVKPPSSCLPNAQEWAKGLTVSPQTVATLQMAALLLLYPLPSSHRLPHSLPLLSRIIKGSELQICVTPDRSPAL